MSAGRPADRSRAAKAAGAAPRTSHTPGAAPRTSHTPRTARAAVLTGPRQIEIRTFEVPEVDDQSGLLRVEACGICGDDYPVFAGRGSSGGVLQIRPPVILGHEIVGRVEEVGLAASQRWGVVAGDRVVLERWIPCGHCDRCYRGEYRLCTSNTGGGSRLFFGGTPTTVEPSLWGGYAEYVHLHPDAVVYKVSPATPAHLFPLFTPLANALCWIQQFGQLRPGGTLVVEGPGQEGLAAVIAGRELGAGTIVVTGLARDAARLELARELGATATLVADRDDLVSGVRKASGGELADVVLDVTDGRSIEPLECAVGMAAEGGTVVMATGHRDQALPAGVVQQVFAKVLTLRGVRGRSRWAIVAALRLIESGRYPLERLCSPSVDLAEVGEALARVGRETDEEVIHVAVTP